jgi:hypothetical protein
MKAIATPAPSRWLTGAETIPATEEEIREDAGGDVLCRTW